MAGSAAKVVSVGVVLAAIACNQVLGIPDVERKGDGGTGSDADAAVASGCSSGDKSCGGACVQALPAVGCNALSCEPCKAIPNAGIRCDPASGLCGVDECAPGYGDCNLAVDDGCELKLGGPDNCSRCGEHCKANQKCVVSDGCACLDSSACGAGGTCDVAAGVCSCPSEIAPCRVGWVCTMFGCTPP